MERHILFLMLTRLMTGTPASGMQISYCSMPLALRPIDVVLLLFAL